MSEKKAAPAKQPERGTIDYVSARAESAPFALKIGDSIVKPVIQPNNSYVWPIPKELHAQALRHTHILTGRLTEK